MDAEPRHGRDLLSAFAGIAIAALAAVSLAGCGGGAGMSGLIDSAGGLFSGSPKIAVAPIVGPPDKIQKGLKQALVTAGADRNLTLLHEGTPGAEYTLKGYVLAAPDRRNSKISYIWDVNDAAGKRVARVTGEETVARGTASDPWRGVDAVALRSIASKSTSQLAAELPGGRRGSSAPVASKPAPTSAGSTAAATSAATATTAAASRPAAQAKPAPKPSGVVVAPVSGAPGDGSRSLPAALKKRLYRDGVKIANGGARNVYTVKGSVKLTSAGSGKEKIRIEWRVLDPNGKSLGTVSQQNTIPKGSLNGPWGAIADAAAGAAAVKLKKFLPKAS